MALGKPKKVILIAQSRKLVTVTNAVIGDQTPFKTTPQT